MVAILCAGYRQIAAYIRRHLFAIDLRTSKRGIPPAVYRDLITRIHRGFILPVPLPFSCPLLLLAFAETLIPAPPEPTPIPTPILPPLLLFYRLSVAYPVKR